MEPASLEAVNHCPSSPDQHGANPATARPDRSSVVPPYWKRHERNPSRMSSFTDDGRPTPISLEDHTDEGSDQCRVLWAKGVTIDDYVVITGTAPGLGAYVVWNCTVETLHGGPMKIRKRYSEFEDLYQKLVQTFPHAAGSMPQFPPKSLVSRFRPRFLEKRKQGLSYFLNCVLLNPEFAGSPVLKDFIFS